VIPFRDVDDTLVRADFKLLARLLIDEGRTVDGVDFAAGWQRNRTCNARTSALRLVNDLARRGVESLMVVGLHTNPEFAAVHCCTP
jgi:hypothetical protein